MWPAIFEKLRGKGRFAGRGKLPKLRDIAKDAPIFTDRAPDLSAAVNTDTRQAHKDYGQLGIR